MREVSERTFKAYAREAVKELNKTELTATVKFYFDGVDIRLFRDGHNVGCAFIYTDGEIKAMDETTGTEIEITPLHNTMKDVFKAIPEAVNAHLDENGFIFEEQETTEEKTAEEIKLSIVRIHLECSIKRWYENAKLDYGISGKFIDCKAQGDNLLIFWEEEGKKNTTKIGYYKDYSPEQIFNIWMEDDGEEVTEEEIRQYIPQEAEEPQPTPEDADKEIVYVDFSPEADFSEEEKKEITETVADIGLEMLEQELTELEKLEEESDKADDAWDKDPMNAELEEASSKAYEREWKKYMDAAKTLAKLIGMDTKTARQMLQRGSKNREKVWSYLNRRKAWENR